MSRFVKHEINSPQMRSVVVLILCTYFWIYLRPPPRCSNFTPLGGAVSLLGGRAPPGVWVIPTLPFPFLLSLPFSLNLVRRSGGRSPVPAAPDGGSVVACAKIYKVR